MRQIKNFPHCQRRRTNSRSANNSCKFFPHGLHLFAAGLLPESYQNSQPKPNQYQSWLQENEENSNLNKIPKNPTTRNEIPKMEDLLVRVHSIIDQMALALQGVGRKVGTRLPKSVKLDHLRKRKINHFEWLLPELQSEWKKIISEVFQTINNIDIIGDIAEYMIRTFYNVSLKYDIDEAHGYSLTKIVVKPVISEIMDIEEATAVANQCQTMRKHFLFKLTTIVPMVQILREESISQNEENQEPMDHENHAPTKFSTQSDASDQPFGQSQQEPPSGLPDYTIWVSEKALDLLFGAICRHSRKVSENKEEIQLVREIYHIMNITHIVDILNRYMETMKSRKMEPDDSRVELRSETYERYQDYISSSLELFEIDHPCSIFRNDLRLLLSKIKVLRSENV